MNCGQETESEIDNEVMSILRKCYEKAHKLIEENQEVLGKLAEHLEKKETITGKEFVEIYEDITGIKLEKRKSEKELMEEKEGKHESESSGS